MTASEMLALPPQEMETVLISRKGQQSLIRQLCELMYEPGAMSENFSSPPAHIKCQAAIAVNWLLRNHYGDLQDSQKLQIYVQFRDSVMLSQNLRWTLLSRMSPSFSVIFANLGQFFAETLSELFIDCPFPQKVIAFQSLFGTNETIENQQKVAFIKGNIGMFIQQAAFFFKDRITIDRRNFQRDYDIAEKILAAICETMSFLEDYDVQSEARQILTKLQSSESLSELFEEVLLISLQKGSEAISRQQLISTEITIISISKDKDKEVNKKINRLKAYVFQIQTVILRHSFKPNATCQAYQQSKCLSRLFKLADPAVTQLDLLLHSYGSKGKSGCLKAVEDEAYSDIVIALLGFLGGTCRYYQTMTAFYESKMQIVVFGIIYPLLETSQKEAATFDEDPEDFLALSNACIEQEQKYSEISSVKESAAALLSLLTKKVDMAANIIVSYSIDAVEYTLSEGRFSRQQLSEVMRVHRLTPSMESLFTMLSLLLPELRQRPEQAARLGRLLTSHKVKELNSLEKTRMFLFLSYAFGTIISRSQDSTNIFEAMVGCEQHQAWMHSVLRFFEDQIANLGSAGQVMWEGLIASIAGSPHRQLFQAISRVIDKVTCFAIGNLTILEIVTMLISRIHSDMSVDRVHGQITGSPILYECLAVLDRVILSSHPNDKEMANEAVFYISNHDQILCRLQNFFRTNLPKVREYEFGKQILQLYSSYLATLPKLEIQHYSFLREYSAVQENLNEFPTWMFQSYLTFLSKGDNLFFSEIKELAAHITQNLISSLDQARHRSDQRSVESILNLFAFLLWKYSGSLRASHEDLNNYFLAFYHLNGEQLEDSSKAALINVLAMGQLLEAQFYPCGSQLIAQNQILIFKGYQGKVMLFILSQTLTREPINTPMQVLTEFCQYNIRLLHCHRQLVNTSENYPSDKNTIPMFRQKDILKEVPKTFEILSGSIGKLAYSKVIDTICEELPRPQLLKLLNTVVINNRPRTVLKVAKRARRESLD